MTFPISFIIAHRTAVLLSKLYADKKYHKVLQTNETNRAIVDNRKMVPAMLSV